MADLSRREALVLAGACACCGMLADNASAQQQQGGNRPTGPAPKSVTIGKLSDFPKVGFYDQFRQQRVMVGKMDDRLVVMSAVCTHRGCLVKIEPAAEPELKCPCHKAVFTQQGTVDSGPAKSSLVRYALTQAADGTITADLTKSFDEKDWDNAQAFISIKPAT